MTSKREASSSASTWLDANQNDVFSFLIDPGNMRRWNETVEYVSHRPHGAAQVGTVILCRISFMGANIQLPYRVVALDEPSSFSGEGSSGVFNYSSRISLVTPGHGGCTVNWNVIIEYPAILAFGSSYVTSRLSSEVKRDLANLRSIFG
jgi:carbon monoxide dehydrogenase subunit G